MHLVVAPELEETIKALARETGRDPQELTDNALRRYVEREAEIVAGIRRGIEAADRGEVVPHDEVVARMEAKLADYAHRRPQ